MCLRDTKTGKGCNVATTLFKKVVGIVMTCAVSSELFILTVGKWDLPRIMTDFSFMVLKMIIIIPVGFKDSRNLLGFYIPVGNVRNSCANNSG